MDPSDRRAGPAVWGLVLAGAVLRIIQVAANRSLWIDEARISLNVAGRSWGGLLRPLDYDQAAPVPFLWAQKLAVQLAGVSEPVLRFLPLVAAILLPLAVWALARRLVDRTTALLATGLTALSPMLVRYANEAKPYSIDALLAVLVVIVAVDLVRAPGDRRQWWRMAGLGLGATLASFPAVMTLAGVGLALLLAPAVRREPGGVARTVAMGAAWLAVFGGLYLALYRAAASGGFLQEFWEFAFLRPGAPDLGARAWSALTGITSGVLVGTLDEGRWGDLIIRGTVAQALVAVGLAGVGAWRIGRRRQASPDGPAGLPVLALLAGPLAAVVLASAAGFYPLTVRLVLFVVPAMLILLAAGITGLVAPWPGRLRTLGGGALAGAFLLPMAGRGVLTSLDPIRQQDMRPVVEEFRERRSAAEAVYVYAPAVPAWVFYTTDWRAPDTVRLRWFARQSSSGGPAFPSLPSRGRPVEGEGAGLVHTSAWGREIIGVPTGRPLRWGGSGVTAPDPGWAAHEAARIRAGGDGTVWVVFMPISPGDREPNLPDLLGAVAREGGTVEFEFHRREADLFRIRFGLDNGNPGPDP